MGDDVIQFLGVAWQNQLLYRLACLGGSSSIGNVESSSA